jgi:hypothetical protein
MGSNRQDENVQNYRVSIPPQIGRGGDNATRKSPSHLWTKLVVSFVFVTINYDDDNLSVQMINNNNIQVRFKKNDCCMVSLVQGVPETNP